MNVRTEQTIDFIIAREGGYVDRAEDRGGPTKYGITIGTLSEVRGKKMTAVDVQTLARTEAAHIYRSRYIVGPGYEKIEDDRVFDLVVDTAVNNGRGRATKWLQRAVGVVEDGILGPITLAKVNASPARAFNGLFAARMKAYGALVSQNHSQAVFIAGWLNRLATFLG